MNKLRNRSIKRLICRHIILVAISVSIVIVCSVAMGWLHLPYLDMCEVYAGDMFMTGDVIAIYSKLEDGWWQGELNGNVGIFPSTYVQEL